MSKSRRELYQRAIDLITRLPGEWTPQARPLAGELLSIADRLNRYNETECNYGLSVRQQARVTNLELRAEEIAKVLGVGIKFNGDPRGYAIKLMLPSGEYNTWGGKEEGWGI
jgi:hypothetical protein